MWQLRKVVGCLKIYLFVLRCSTKSKIDAFLHHKKEEDWRDGLERPLRQACPRGQESYPLSEKSVNTQAWWR